MADTTGSSGVRSSSLRAEAASFGQVAGPGPEVSSSRLDNGLEIVVIPDRRVPVATHMVWYRNGSADDPIGQSGIAHFLEHLMFKGTDRNPAGEFSKVVSSLGGQENAFTSFDYTAYFQRVAKDHLGRMMEFESDRMAGLNFGDDVVAPERNVVLEERRMRVETDPSAQLSEAMAASLFVHHPYGIPIIGWMHEIETLNRTNALDYYRRFYAPDNAILVVAGDVTADEVHRLADSTYGRHAPRGGAAPIRLRPREPDPTAARHLCIADPKVEQPTLHRLYLVPSTRTATGRDAFALEVLAEALGGGATSYLYRKLVMETGRAVNAGAWYMGSAIDETRFSVYAVPAEGLPPEAVEADLDAAMASMKDGLDADSIERAKTRLVAETIYSSDSQSSLARIYGSALAVGETLEDVRRWPDEIRSITRDDLVSIAERFLRKKRSVTGHLVKDGPC
jgi:zinc protease